MKEIGEANERGDTQCPNRCRRINKVEMVSASFSCLDQLITIKIQTSYFVAMKAGSQIHKEKKRDL